MDSKLLSTKLFPPKLRKQYILRPRLFQLLEQNNHCKACLVTAPAGFGKSTLVTSWLHQRNKNFGWISLDTNDNSLVIFISYIVEALQELKPGIGHSAISLIDPDEPESIRQCLVKLVNELSEIKENFCLAIDDYHLIKNPKIHKWMSFLIKNTPENINFLILSRNEPDLKLSRLRASGNISEISEEHLRFSHSEIGQFLQSVFNVNLQQEEIRFLKEKTEGWITAIQLAAIGLVNNEQAKDEILAIKGTNQFISEYLIDEVLSSQEENVITFLTHTSILKQFNAELCNYLLNIRNSSEIIEFLETENMFLISLDNRKEWYRYHHLFAELLRNRLKKDAPQTMPNLYQKAIDWHRQQKMESQAISYALESKDYQQAANVINETLKQPQTGIQMLRNQNWFEQIPPQILRNYPDLWLQYNLALFYFSDFEKALKILKETTSEQQDPFVEAMEATLLGAILLHNTMDAPKVRELTQFGLNNIPEDRNLIRGIAYGHYGSASLYMGELETARKHLQDAIHCLQKTHNWPVLYVFRIFLAETLLAQGALHKSAELLKLIYHSAFNRNVINAILTGNLTGLALIHYEWNQVAEAENYVQMAFEMVNENRTIDRIFQVLQVLVLVKIPKDEYSEIEKVIQILEESAAAYDYPLLVLDRIECYSSFLAMKKGEIVSANRWARIYAQRHQDNYSYMNEQEWLTIAKINLEMDKPDQAIEILQSLQESAKKDGRKYSLLKISILLVQAYQRKNRRDTALKILEKCLKASQEERYIRSFIDGGIEIESLINEISERSDLPKSFQKYVNTIKTAFHPSSAKKSPLLTPREIDVIQYLALGNSYQEISDELNISINTTKFHTKNIFSKLSAKNRTEAVRLAQKNGIL